MPSDLRVDGAVALVTGASGALGRTICSALRSAGARVIATDIVDAPSELSVDAWWRHDVTSAADWERVASDVHRQFGHLDCLVNSAGIALVERFSTMSIAQWRRVMSVNVESMVFGMQATLALLNEGGKDRVGGSSVVNIASTAGLRGVAFSSAYCASKAAVTLLSKATAKEFAALRYPIRVNAVHPSAVESNMMESIVARYVETGIAASIEQQNASANAKRPLGRMAHPDEIAGGVVFLCSTAASFMTGSDLVIDGAVTA